MNYYQFRIYDQKGQFVQIIEQFDRLDIVRSLNSVGVLELSWPIQFAPSLSVDYAIILEVSVNQRSTMQIWGETCYFIQEIEYNGTMLNVTALDALSLLTRRIVAYPSQNAFTVKSAPADDIIKELVRENAGQNVIDDRRTLPNFTIENDTSKAIIVDAEMAYVPLLESMKDVAESAEKKGDYVYFDVLSDYSLNLHFRTYFQYRGADRRSIILNGNHINDMQLSIDWTDSKNVIYVGGSGSGVTRAREVVINEQSTLQSRYGWREGYEANRNVGDSDILIDDGLSALQEAEINFSGDFINQPDMEFGKHIHFGDIITVQAYGSRFECIIKTIDLSINNGVERMRIELEAGNYAE